MFERFTRDARRAVKAAVDAATELGHRRVDTVHMLLGISAQGGPTGDALAGFGLTALELRRELASTRALSAGGDVLDAEALSAIGIDYDAVRQAAEARFGPGALAAAGRRPPRLRPWWSRRGHIPFAGESKRALVRSLEVAQRRHDRELGPLHILLGILDDPFCTAYRYLDERGVSAEALRAALSAG